MRKFQKALLLAIFILPSSVCAAPKFSDTFEGPLPTGWRPEWQLGWDHEIMVNNTTEGIPTFSGGGNQAFRQWWDGTNNTGSWSTAGGLVLDFNRVDGMSSSIGRLADGAGSDELEFGYAIYFDPQFDWGDTTGFKKIIARNDQATDLQQLYVIISRAEGAVQLFFQHTTDTGALNSNVNGSRFLMPKGEWVHFEWRIKVAPQQIPDGSGGWIPNPNINGHVQGWVNGELRWDYNNIATIERGNYVTLNINPTFNPGPNGVPRPPDGPHQKRYWDNFSLSDHFTGGQPPTNQPPVLAPIGPKSVNENALLTFTVSATDPDSGQTLTYSASGLPSGATFIPATRTFSWTPNFSQNGTYNVTFTVTDNGSPQLSDSETIQIVVNDGPQPAVVFINIINTDTNEERGELNDGAEINLAAIHTSNITFVAETINTDQGSVQFELAGIFDNTDNNIPYSLRGEQAGRYMGWTAPVGDYRLTVTPYSQPDRQGNRGDPVTINFKVVYNDGESNPGSPGSNNKTDSHDKILNLTKEKEITFTCENQVQIFSRTGKAMKTLECFSGEAHWDGTNTKGNVVPAGVYFGRSQNRNVIKFLLMK